ncbi:unnamed protein product, partial [Discosporangium mesarthrocarpum]
APEVFKQLKYTMRADTYSFAMVVWEMFMGRRPFGRMQPFNFAYQVAHNGFRPEIILKADKRDPERSRAMPKDISRLVQDCWDAKPGSRPSFPTIRERLS